MAWFLLELHPTRPSFPADASPDELQAVDEHFARLARMAAAGHVAIVGRTQEATDPLGLCVFEAIDESTARQMADDDPAVQAGVFHAAVRPYRIALGSPTALQRALAEE